MKSTEKAERYITEDLLAVMRTADFRCCVCQKKVDRIERYGSETNTSFGLRFICHNSFDDYEISMSMLAAPACLKKIRPFEVQARAIRAAAELKGRNSAPSQAQIAAEVLREALGSVGGSTPGIQQPPKPLTGTSVPVDQENTLFDEDIRVYSRGEWATIKVKQLGLDQIRYLNDLANRAPEQFIAMAQEGLLPGVPATPAKKRKNLGPIIKQSERQIRLGED